MFNFLLPFVRSIILSALLLLPHLSYADSSSTNADLLFNWAEATFPLSLTSIKDSQSNGDHYYRGPYLQLSGDLLYLGVTTTAAPHVMMVDTGISNDMFDLGLVSTWVSKVSYTDSTSSGGGDMPSDGNSTDTPQPPQEAIDACAGLSEGDQCTMETPDGETMSSTCSAQDGQLACMSGDMDGPSDGDSTGDSGPGTQETSGSGEVTTCTAVYTLDSDAQIFTNQTLSADITDTSAVCTKDDAELTLIDPIITTSGDSSALEDSSFYGLNAGILAISGSNITVSGGSITTTGSGANGAFATGSGSSISLKDVTISATGRGGHGVDATLGGSLALMNVTAYTTGANGSVIATDRGGGTITVSGGSFTAEGTDSAGVYSTGVVTVAGAKVTAANAEAVVIEGGNSAVMTRCEMFAGKGTRDRGMFVYQSMSGDASQGAGSLTINGGSYTWPSTTGPAFYVTNNVANITLNGVTINNSSDVLLEAAADQWGTSGSNGGTVNFRANAQTLTGDIVLDEISSVDISLSNGSTLTGAINSEGTAAAAMLTLDKNSVWNLTGDSHLTGLVETGGTTTDALSNIMGNGYNVYYDASNETNMWLENATYSLSGGGQLIPE